MECTICGFREASLSTHHSSYHAATILLLW